MSYVSTENVPTNEAVTVSQEKTENKQAERKRGPADDLRDIQALLVQGIFPGNAAPAIVKAYQLLEQMAVQVEKEASKVPAQA